MNLVVQHGVARATKDINLRKGEPSTRGAVVRQVLSGQVIQFIGWVTDGESISGKSKWFKTEDGNYFWSGNAQVLPPTPIPPSGYQAITATQLRLIVPSVSTTNVVLFVDALNSAMQEFSINTPLRQCAFIAQTAHESMGYTTFVENLNYSKNALLATWPRRFTEDTAILYARKPEKIANRVYRNRLGNGNEASGDGWKYRGRGIIQTTGKDNYKACGAGLGVDLLTSPKLLEQPLYTFRSGAWFWNSRNLNPLADQGDFTKITQIINGGLLGLDDRLLYYTRAKRVLGIS
jgi:putative chitinase